MAHALCGSCRAWREVDQAPSLPHSFFVLCILYIAINEKTLSSFGTKTTLCSSLLVVSFLVPEHIAGELPANNLKRKLLAILDTDTITDAEDKAEDKREGAKAWLEKVRKVAYQASDVLDEFKYEALRRKAEEGHKIGMDVKKIFPSYSRVVFRYKMAKRLCMILKED
jgi:hypothetical protein